MSKSRSTAHLSETERIQLSIARRQALVVGVAVPAILTVIGVTLMCMWLPRMPHPMASHWGSSGGPDGFTAPVSNLIFAIVTLVGTVALMAGIVLLLRRPTQTMVWSATHRFMAAFSAAMSAFMVVVLVGTFQLQLDAVDATEVGGVGTVLLVGTGATVVLGVLGWVVQPALRIDRSIDHDAQPLKLDADSHAVWVATVKPGKLFLGIMIPSLILLATGTVWMYAVQDSGWWVMGGTCLLITLLFVSTGAFHITVNQEGLVARSFIGWPVFRVPLEKIDRVTATEISPFAEFGGVGLRGGPGRLGIVYRKGMGIVINKLDGTMFAATVDDAETGAALLATFVHQRESRE